MEQRSRIGLVARADNTGLGNQTYEFYQHMKPHKTMVVDISHLNGNAQYPERYPNAQYVRGFPRPADIEEFLQGLDVIFVAESPYNYYLYQRARELGVKVAVQYNYEFFDWYSYPHYPLPDMLIAPSMWNYDVIEKFSESHNIKHMYLHCPVNRERLPFAVRKQARNFLHIAGKPAAHDRNGTLTAIEAFRRTQDTDIRLTVTTQGETPEEWIKQAQYDPRILFKNTLDLIDYARLYDDYDVLVFPRRYGGNCLPLNEALSVGMPVIMSDISPNNHLLPNSWLAPAYIQSVFKPRMEVNIYETDITALSHLIEDFADLSSEDMQTWSNVASTIASQFDWNIMKLKYEEALRSLL